MISKMLICKGNCLSAQPPYIAQQGTLGKDPFRWAFPVLDHRATVRFGSVCSHNLSLTMQGEQNKELSVGRVSAILPQKKRGES
jgi:hypothetical protein